MSSSLHLTFIATLLLATAGCAGSGDGLPREPISGKVMLDGQPLDGGMITFLPEGGGEPVVSSVVKDGAFELPRADGPIAGGHRVTIWATKPTGRMVPDPDNRKNKIEETRNIIPRRYNVDSGLKAEVKTQAENSFTFDLSGREEPRRFSQTQKNGMKR